MSTSVGQLTIDMAMNVMRITRDLGAVREGFDKTLGHIDTQIEAVKKSMAGLVAGLTVGAMVAFTMNTLNAAAGLHDLSIKSGMAVESLSGLAAVGKTSGATAEMIAASSNKLSKNLATSTEESKGAAAAIKALGLDWDTFQKMNPAQRMQAVALAMGAFKDGGQKSAAAMLLFGKTGAELLPFLKDLAQTSELHAKITGDQARAADDFTDKLTILKARSESWKKQLAFELLPTMDAVLNELLAIQKEVNGEKAGKSLLGETLTTAFQTISVLGANVVYVLKEMGYELGGMAAQAMAILRLDWGQVPAIRAAMVADADDRRRKIDQRSLNLMGITNSDAGAGRASTGFKDPRVLGAIPDFHKELTGLVGDGKGTKEADGEKAYDGLIKRIRERIALGEQEKKLQRELTEEEKFTHKVRTDLEELMKRFPGLNKAQVDSLLKTSAALFQENEQRKRKIKMMQEEAAFIMQVEEETSQAEADDSKRREQFASAITAEYASLKNSKEALEAEATALLMTDRERTVYLGGLRLEADLKQKLWDLDHNGAFNETQREMERARLKDVSARQRDLLEQQASMGEFQKQWQASMGEFQKQWQDMDGVARGFFRSLVTNGGNAFQQLRDLLQTKLIDYLYEQTLRPFVLNIVAGVTGGGGAAGAAASAASQGGMSALGSGVGAMFGAGGLGGSLAAGAGWMTGATTLGGSLTAATSLMATGTGAGIMSGIGMMAGALGPIALGIMALYAVLSKQGETRHGGQFTGTSLIAAPSGGGYEAGIPAIQGTMDTINRLLSSLGSSSRLGSFYSGFEDSKNGKGFAYARGTLSSGAQFGNWNGEGYMQNRGSMTPEESAKAFSQELMQATLGALQADLDNLPSYVGRYLKGVDVDALSVEAAQGILASFDAIQKQRAQLEADIYKLTTSAEDQATRARQEEIDALDEANKELGRRKQQLEDEAKATEAAVKQAERMAGIESRAKGIAKDFLTPEQYRGFLIQEVQQRLAQVGWHVTADAIANVTRSQFVEIWHAVASSGFADGMDALLDVAGSIIELQPAADTASDSVRQLKEELMGLGQDIYFWLRDLKANRAGISSPEAVLSATRQNYQQDLMLAQANDPDALRRITGSAQAYIEAQKNYTASNDVTETVIANVIAQMSALPAVQSYETQSLAVLTNIAAGINALPSALITGLGSKFDAIDRNTDGLLTAAELRASGLATDSQITQLMSTLDSNGDGMISRQELTTAALGTTNDRLLTLLDRIGTDSLLAYSATTVATVYTAIARGATDTAYWTNKISLQTDDLWRLINSKTFGTAPAQTAGSIAPPPTTTVATTPPPTVTTPAIVTPSVTQDDIAAYQAAQASGLGVYGFAASLGYTAAQTSAWLANTGFTPFASGGAFTNGVVSGPASFNMGLMGEGGPEAIMPLSNVGGVLGVSAMWDPETNLHLMNIHRELQSQTEMMALLADIMRGSAEGDHERLDQIIDNTDASNTQAILEASKAPV